jgi:hypothetical protein
MESINALRAFLTLEVGSRTMPKVEYDEISGMLDKIEMDHAKAVEAETSFCKRLKEAAKQRDDVTIFGTDYTALPLDRDGEPVHLGDLMEWPTTNETFEVVGIGDGTLFYVEDGNEKADWTGASTKRHHEPDTWERIIEDAIRGDGGSYGCLEERFDAMVPALVARCRALAGEDAS